MFKKTLLAAALTAVVSFGASAAPAASGATATGTFHVNLTVNSTCVVNTTAASDVNFTAVNAGTAPTSGQGSFSVNCSNTTPFNIGLAPSNNSTSGTGVMTGPGGATIAYQLYSDAATKTAWGNTATASSVGNGVSGTGTGMASANAIAETVYAAVTGSTDVAPGAYTDTVTINVNY